MKCVKPKLKHPLQSMSGPQYHQRRYSYAVLLATFQSKVFGVKSFSEMKDTPRVDRTINPFCAGLKFNGFG